MVAAGAVEVVEGTPLKTCPAILAVNCTWPIGLPVEENWKSTTTSVTVAGIV
jgi:hypothetical protein